MKNDLQLWMEPSEFAVCFVDDGSDDDGGEGGAPAEDEAERLEHDDGTDDRDENDDGIDEAKLRELAKKQGFVTPEEAEEQRRRAAADARRKERDRLRKRKPKNDKPQGKAQEAAPRATEDPYAWRDAFDDALDELDGVKLTKKQRKRMKKDFKRAYGDGEIDDAEEWAREWCDDFGFLPDEDDETETTTKATKDDPVPTKAKKPVVVPDSAPRPIEDFTSLRDPNQLTADDKRRIYQKMGRQKGNRFIREMAERWYQGRPIVR